MDPSILLGGASLLLRAGWNKLFKEKSEVKWSGHMLSTLKPSDVRDDLLEAFREEPYYGRVVEMDADRFIMKRGDWSVTGSVSHDWHRLPLIVAVTHSPFQGKTRVHLYMSASDDLSFDDVDREFFNECATADFEYVCSRLKIAENLTHELEHATAQDPVARAYAALQLHEGSPWPDVHAAYHEACKQYHPDALSGQNVPAHLVELAVREIKVKTEAYQLLKRHLAA